MTSRPSKTISKTGREFYYRSLVRTSAHPRKTNGLCDLSTRPGQRLNAPSRPLEDLLDPAECVLESGFRRGEVEEDVFDGGVNEGEDRVQPRGGGAVADVGQLAGELRLYTQRGELRRAKHRD